MKENVKLKSSQWKLRTRKGNLFAEREKIKNLHNLNSILFDSYPLSVDETLNIWYFGDAVWSPKKCRRMVKITTRRDIFARLFYISHFLTARLSFISDLWALLTYSLIEIFYLSTRKKSSTTVKRVCRVKAIKFMVFWKYCDCHHMLPTLTWLESTKLQFSSLCAVTPPDRKSEPDPDSSNFDSSFLFCFFKSLFNIWVLTLFLHILLLFFYFLKAFYLIFVCSLSSPHSISSHCFFSTSSALHGFSSSSSFSSFVVRCLRLRFHLHTPWRWVCIVRIHILKRIWRNRSM